MILLYCGSVSLKSIDALAVFALQLNVRGHQIAIDDRLLPEASTKQIKFEIAPFLVNIEDVEPSMVIVIGADQVSDEVQSLLGTLALGSSVPVWVLGHFAGLQDEINARNKVAYAAGQEPEVLNLATIQRTQLIEGSIGPSLTEIANETKQSQAGVARVLVYVPSELLQNEETVLNQLSALDYNPEIEVHVLTNSDGKDRVRNSRFSGLSVFGYSELPPTDLHRYGDVLVFTGKNVPGERMANLALTAMGAGKVVVDCTHDQAFAAAGAPVLKGPVAISGMSVYLQETVVPNRGEIGRRIQQSDWLRQFDVSVVESTLKLVAPKTKRRQQEPSLAGKTLFLPTNGNGLGHAQRCALIAEALPKDHLVEFAAFPSCVDMLSKRSFSCTPLVQRSAEHEDEYASDLVNFLRLSRIMTEQDQLVFDGGYVFDSVYRTISRLQIPAVWIRRGLWQPGQINPVALERERAFSKVIVPVEAFDELNADYSSNDKITKTGPIVQRKKLSKAQIAKLRSKLGTQFQRDIDTLVVTMLGGGVASERTVQTQVICNLMERLPNCLHLVIAWPHAFVSSSLHGWKNTEVVHTTHAADLCQVADLCISAAGYNSFHELLYAHVPTILIPQSAKYLDDQERRARAASERGLMSFVMETELLQLEREILDILESGKAEKLRAALEQAELPEIGNATAARLIKEGMQR